MESSTGLLQPTRRAPPPPRLPSSTRPIASAAAGPTAPKSTARRTGGTPPLTPVSSVPAPRAKLSQSLSMPFVRRQSQNHINGRKKAPPPRPPPPKVSLPSNRLKNNVQDNNTGGRDNDAVLIDLSPTPSSSSGSLHFNLNSDQQQFSLLDAPISSCQPEKPQNNGSNGHVNFDPFGSIEEDSLPPNNVTQNQGMNWGSNGRVSSTVEFPSFTSYNSIDLDSTAPTTIDWSLAKSSSVSTSNEPASRVKSQFYTDASASENGPRGGLKKKPTIIKPKNVTISCVPPSQAGEPSPDSGVATSGPGNCLQKSFQSYAIAEFDYQSSEVGDLCFQAGDTIEDVTVVNSEWLEGRLRGAKGIFPAAFVKVVDNIKVERGGNGALNPAETKALYDFHAEMPTDLPLKEGQTVTVTAVIEGGEWLLGHSGGRTGQFPANFVAYVPPNLPVVTL